MRILLGVILLTVGILGLAGRVLATDWELEAITLRAAWQKDGDISTTYELRTMVGSDWFQLQTAAKIYGSGTNYYALTNYITFEKYLKDLELNLGAEESAEYKFINVGAGLQEKILENWRIHVDYAIENRIPKKVSGSSYRADTEQVQLDYQGNSVQYCVRLRRQWKDYPADLQYTSLKYTFENTLRWEPSPTLGFDVTYQEDNGAYPTRIAQNFWKDKWSFGGCWNPSKTWTVDWDYSTQEWFKGFFPYRRDYWYQSGIRFNPNPDSEWSLSAGVHGLAYCDTDFPRLTPGEWRTDETKSRTEEKVNLEYCWRRGIFAWSLGYFIERADVLSDAVPDKQGNGWYSSVDLNFRHFNFNISMTPGGSIGNRYSRYQLLIGYKPD